MQYEANSAGSIVSLWRYPVKSMMGEEINSSLVTERGLLGDRSYALVDLATGKVVSAKNPRKWPGMFGFRAVYVEPPDMHEGIPPVRITMPDGLSATSAQDNLDSTSVARIGRRRNAEIEAARKSAARGVLARHRQPRPSRDRH